MGLRQKKVESKPDKLPKIAVICLLMLHAILTIIASNSTISIVSASEEIEPKLYTHHIVDSSWIEEERERERAGTRI